MLHMDILVRMVVYNHGGMVILVEFVLLVSIDYNNRTRCVYFLAPLLVIFPSPGDVTPKTPHARLIGFAMLVIGMALVSMCFNVVAIKMEAIGDRMRRKVMKAALTLVQKEGVDAGSSTVGEGTPSLQDASRNVGCRIVFFWLHTCNCVVSNKCLMGYQ
jgi:hypothetical protein